MKAANWKKQILSVLAAAFLLAALCPQALAADGAFAAVSAVQLEHEQEIMDAMNREQANFFAGIGAPLNLLNMAAYYNQHNATTQPYTVGTALEMQYQLDPLYGYPSTDWDLASAELLDDSWGITDQDSLIEQLDALFATGHRSSYRAERDEQQLPEWFLQKWGEAVDADSALLGWDLGRAIMLCQWGHCAGYLSADQALAYMLPAAEILQENFDSWQAYSSDYLMGFDRFLGADAVQDDYGQSRVLMVQSCYVYDTFRDSEFQVELSDLAEYADPTVQVKELDSGNTGMSSTMGTLIMLALMAVPFVVIIVVVVIALLISNKNRRRAAAQSTVLPSSTADAQYSALYGAAPAAEPMTAPAPATAPAPSADAQYAALYAQNGQPKQNG